MNKILLTLAGTIASLFTVSAEEVKTVINFDLDFKDATITYTKEGTEYKDVPVTSLDGNKAVVSNVTMKLGDLTFILCNKESSSTPVGDVALSYSSETGALATSWEYVYSNGSYDVQQTINNIYWRVCPKGSADNTAFEKFQITSPEGSQPLPLPQYTSSNKANGGFKWIGNNRTVAEWNPYNNNPVFQVTLPNMGKNQESYPEKLKTFEMQNIKGSYYTTSNECTDFTEVRALSNGAEFKFTGEAYVTWRWEDELWLRDSKGDGMYFKNAKNIAAEVTNGYKLTGPFMAVYEKYSNQNNVDQKEYERDICSIAEGSVPTFETGTEPQYPIYVTAEDVEAFPQQGFNTIVRIFPQKFDGQYVTIIGKFLEDLNDFNVALRGKFINVGTDANPEIIILDLGYIKGPELNPYGHPTGAGTWYAGGIADGFTDYDKNDYFTVQGLVMRNTGNDVSTDSKGGELMVTYMQNNSIVPTGVDNIINNDSSAPVIYYDLTGRLIANPESGIYIRRQGKNTTKVIF